MSSPALPHLDPAAYQMIKDLAYINLASAAGFASAANSVGDPTLTDLFMTAGGASRRCGGQLCRLLGIKAELPPQHGRSIEGVVRWWIDLRSRYANDYRGLLAAVERGQDHIVQAYAAALQNADCTPVHDVLTRHRQDINAVRDRVRFLIGRISDPRKPD